LFCYINSLRACAQGVTRTIQFYKPIITQYTVLIIRIAKIELYNTIKYKNKTHEIGSKIHWLTLDIDIY
jgi:hypothetical protein